MVGRKILVGQDLDTSYDSLESLANAAVQDAQPAGQVNPTHLNSMESLTSKSPTTIFSPPTPPIPKQQVFLKDVDDDEQQLIRTALSVLGHQMTGKMEDVRDLARRIIGDGPSSWDSSNPLHNEVGNAPVKSTFPTLSESSHNYHIFSPNPRIQLPKEPVPMQCAIHDEHDSGSDGHSNKEAPMQPSFQNPWSFGPEDHVPEPFLQEYSDSKGTLRPKENQL